MRKNRALLFSTHLFSLLFFECQNVLPVVGRGNLLVLSELAAVSAADHPGAGLVLAKHTLHGVCDFTHRAPERATEITQLFYLKGKKAKPASGS